MPDGHGNRLSAVAGTEFPEDPRHVDADGVLADPDALRDLGIGESLREEREHFAFAGGQRVEGRLRDAGFGHVSLQVVDGEPFDMR